MSYLHMRKPAPTLRDLASLTHVLYQDRSLLTAASFLTPLDINLWALAIVDELHQGKDCQRVHRDAHTWKLGCMVPVVTQSPSEAYPMGGLGLQKVSPRSEPSILVSMMAPAGPTAGGWLLHICTNIVVRATGLQGAQVPRYSDCIDVYLWKTAWRRAMAQSH